MKSAGMITSWCLAIFLISMAGCLRQNETSKTESSKETKSDASSIRVHCVIEFNGRRDRIESDVELDSDKATAFEALKALAEKESLQVESRGEGESLFVVSVGGFANDGAGGKNWIYKVDGKLGDRSSEIFDVTQGQQIQWSLGMYP